MSGSSFWRLVWKEYRVQRGFWLTMAAGALLLQLVLLWAVEQENDLAPTLFVVSLAMSTFYGLGSAATLFATEHETGTFDFQQALPVGAWRLFLGKSFFAVASTVLLSAVLLPVTYGVLRLRVTRPDVVLDACALWGIATMSILAWGIFFSLLMKAPLKAAIVAAVVALFCTYCVTYFVSDVLRTGDDRHIVYALLAAAGVVALVDCWLGCRWASPRSFWSSLLARLPRFRAVSPDSAQAVEPMAIRPGPRVFGRLLWQQWRQSAGLLAVVTAAVFVAVVMVATIPQWLDRDWRFVRNLASISAVVLTYILPPMVGACVFLADQRRRSFRFLAERGVSARYVWLSRQFVWIAALLCWTGVVLPLLVLIRVWLDGDVTLKLLGYAVGFVVVAYASGQVASLFFPNGAVAVGAALVLTCAICLWAVLMHTLQISWFWSVAPLPPALLLATWFRTPHWLLQRNGLRGWLLPGLALLIPTAALLTAVPLYRIDEIPDVDLGLSIEEYTQPATAEARATVDLYRRATESISWTPGVLDVLGDSPVHPKEIAWVDANERTIVLTLEASEREACDFFDPEHENELTEVVQRCRSLARLLIADGRRFESQGQPEAAWDRYLAALRMAAHLHHRPTVLQASIAVAVEGMVYERLPHWAVGEGQTPQRIRAVIGQLDELAEQRAPTSDVIGDEYAWMRQLLLDDSTPRVLRRSIDKAIEPVRYWTGKLPWERTRTLRLLDLVTSQDLEALRGVEEQLAQGKRAELPQSALSESTQQQVKTTPFLAAVYGDMTLQLGKYLVRTETRRRAAQLLLAIQAWKREHGRLPEQLDVLVGPYFEQLPTDPYSGRSFRYFPDGQPIPITYCDPTSYFVPNVAASQTVEAGQPFLWSTGVGVQILGASEELIGLYRITMPDGRSRRPTAEHDIWPHGWLFPLP